MSVIRPSILPGCVKEVVARFELEGLASELAGMGWKTKIPLEMNSAELAAFQHATNDELVEWMSYIADAPLPPRDDTGSSRGWHDDDTAT